jgi:putative membrane-bound dehydrogenase-like protein
MMLKTPLSGRAHFRPIAPCRKHFAKVLLALVSALSSAIVIADDSLGVKVADGFEISLYADNELASDIFALTVDSLGRVVVSGPGYVRILIDENGDGRADSFQQFADGPASGAQGLVFHGRDLICTGDGGLLRYRDQDGDDRADGPPDVFLKIKAGGEHDAHAIRRGPDGWWYLITGNTAEVDERYVALPSSPVRRPRQGSVLRFRPDLTTGEVFAHGYRNAYDFDFSTAGDVYTFDSDGEREISLPAYQPTRVFQVAPGSHAGWMSDHWKRPGYFFDMPPVVAEFGRASPTGVVCYRHTQFPEDCRGALFVLDWTFGRIFALPVDEAGNIRSTREPIAFLTTIGDGGFAPTDAEIGPDGSMYVSVGGRGTRGAVYRIRATGRQADPSPFASEKLLACLDAPQPLSAWSRAMWEPLADVLGAAPFQRAASDERESLARRIRAIEILTERFKGLDGATANRLAASPVAPVRARLAWSLGRTRPDDPSVPLMQLLLKDRDPIVQRAALETTLCADTATLDELAVAIGSTLGSADRYVRMTGVRVLARMSRAGYQKASTTALTIGPAAGVAVALAFTHRHPGYQQYSLDIARRILESKAPLDTKLEAARLMQVALGDVGASGEDIPQAFEGYTSRVNLAPHAGELEPALKAVTASFPTPDARLNRELGRVMAILQPGDPLYVDGVLKQITEASDPVDDIHWLLIAGRINAPRKEETTLAVAKALLQLDAKIRSRNLLIDTHWDEQLSEIYSALVERDERLPLAILKDSSFGRPAHIQFVSALPIENLNDAILAFSRQIQADPEYRWNAEVVFLLSRSEDPEIQRLVRSKFDDHSLRGAVLLSLSELPQEADRPLFVAGLENSPEEIVTTCINCLLELPPSQDGDEQRALARVLRRLGDTRAERRLRSRIFDRLAANHGIQFEDGEEENAPTAVQQWLAFIDEKFPAPADAAAGGGAREMLEMLTKVDWAAGDAARGHKLFESRACAQCHNGKGAIGPDLSGAARRFSKPDLFTAIADPSRDVSPRYQTTAISTVDGRSYTGLIIYESVDYVVVRNATNQTSRIEKKHIEEQRTLSQSLMPGGLLKDLGPGDLADLHAYLRELGAARLADQDPPAQKQ